MRPATSSHVSVRQVWIAAALPSGSASTSLLRSVRAARWAYLTPVPKTSHTAAQVLAPWWRSSAATAKARSAALKVATLRTTATSALGTAGRPRTPSRSAATIRSTPTRHSAALARVPAMWPPTPATAAAALSWTTRRLSAVGGTSLTTLRRSAAVRTTTKSVIRQTHARGVGVCLVRR